jgi:hypothetical protein
MTPKSIDHGPHGDVVSATSGAALVADNAEAAKFESFLRLENGWNSYSAPSPSVHAIENAKELVHRGKDANLSPVRIEPSAMGGVGVTFARGDREVVAECYNNGTTHAHFADNTKKEMDTKAILLTVDGMHHFFDDAKAFLHA